MKEVRIDSIMYDLVNKCPVVILKELNGDRYLPILIGMFEASAIEMGITGKNLPRPMTHDLLNSVFEQLELAVEYIHITKIEDSTFYANIHMFNTTGDSMEIDSRPSDAIALAIRTRSPILVAEDVLGKAGMRMNPHDVVDGGEETSLDNEIQINPDEPGIQSDEVERRFRDFVDELKPEDFISNDTTYPDTGLDEHPSDD